MKWFCLIALCLPSNGITAVSGFCNVTGFYVGETHVVLTVLWSGRSGSDERAIRSLCGEHVLEGNLIRRVFADLSGKPAFGYNLLITPNLAKRSFQIRVAKPGRGLVTFARLPDPVTVIDGDRVDVPVLENPQTGVRILDSYAIAMAGTGVAPLSATHDFPNYAPGGTLLNLEQPRLRSDVSDLGDNSQFGITGPVVWVYSRWLGRLSFSAGPRAGYRRLGVAEGSTIHFSDGVEHYRMDLQSDVIKQRGAWWLWVRREPEFTPPPGPWTPEELRRGILALGADR
jgi:hypothetical protein